MNRLKTIVAASAVALTSLIGTVAVAETAAGASGEPGIWREHKYSFVFAGFTSTYSCDGLADKLRILLLAAGARPDVKALPGGCPYGYGHPDRLARADVTFYTLEPDSSVRSADHKNLGTWRAVAFTDRTPRELQLGDCELVEQFQQHLLPMFTARNIENHTTCVPHQFAGSLINLKFETFAPPPSKALGKSRY